MRIRQKKNRKTGSIIELHSERVLIEFGNWINWYWCRCTKHNTNEKFKHFRKRDALRSMAHPDEWCKECAKIAAAKNL